MSTPETSLSTVPPPVTFERRQELFESNWRSWRPGLPLPRWQDFLPTSGEPCTSDHILLLLGADIEFRVKAGQPALLAETYFQHQRLALPDARLSDEQQRELIHWEYQQRWNRGERVPRQVYLERFPEHAAAMQDLKPLWNCPGCGRNKIPIDENADEGICPRCGARVPVEKLFAPPGDATGLDLRDYQLLEELGRGGMGEVYRSRDPGLDRDLALKVIKADWRGNAEVEQRFANEARITGSLQHPGIVPVYNLGRLRDGRLYFTMKVVRGGTFAEMLSAPGAAEKQGTHLGTFAQVCQAVAYAHSKGVIHRDLKPENVMVGRFGEVQVMDWGLAKVLMPSGEKRQEAPAGLSELVTPRSLATGVETRGALGTPEYMSPEQANGEWERADERLDVFALGGILCTLLTGKPPYIGGSREEVWRKAQRGDLTEAFAGLDGSGADSVLVSLAKECLCAEVAGRPRDAAVVAQRLAAYQAAVQERLRAAEVERAAALVRAKEATKKLWLAVAGLLFLLAGIAGTTWGVVRAEQQRSAAERSKKEALDREAELRAVLDFVENRVIAAARPAKQAGGRGYDVKLADAVKWALPYVETSFSDQPLIEARLRMTLGTSFLYLGKVDIAVAQHEKARTLFIQHLGPDHPNTLASMANLANSYSAAGRTQDALKLREETHARRKATLGPDHPETLRSMNNLAQSYFATGRRQDALKLHEETLKRKKAVVGPDHPDTLGSMNNLANAFEAVGRMQEALKLRQETLERQKATLGSDHPDTLASMNNLAESYFFTGRTQKAVNLHEETLKRRKVILGPDHPLTLTSMNNLAISYAAVGRTQEALKLDEETLRRRKVILGPDHPATLKSMDNLAASYFEAGRVQEALKLQQEALKLLKATLGLDHPSTLTGMNNLAVSFTAVGRTQDALKLREETLKLMKPALGTGHPSTLLCMNNLAISYTAAGRAQDAVALLQQTLALREARLRAEPGNTLEQAYLAWTHGQLGEAEQARLDFVASAKAYAQSVETFEKLDHAAALKDPIFRDRLTIYRQQLALCRKAEQAVRDLAFALKQPPAEVPGLLDLRLQVLVKRKDRPGVVATAEAYAKLAEKDAAQLYNAACAWSLASGLSGRQGAGAAALAEEYAGKALALLWKAKEAGKSFKTPAAMAAHIKQDHDMDPLRQREDFKKLMQSLAKPKGKGPVGKTK
jgi:serine/threonine protein kinase